ncbi:hypothetical protein B0T24DRAFT_125233 [Lasiosphaeria ovina]|uniref:Uncharacterized protein n=1 Tax=Lasiosphaeria ovina TaxID=92902 RepID=A0AAE0MXH6_9PEZI|nr:hypothetical protein B0T24DRAFT_125233 [Lasiosphaeria ovina]
MLRRVSQPTTAYTSTTIGPIKALLRIDSLLPATASAPAATVLLDGVAVALLAAVSAVPVDVVGGPDDAGGVDIVAPDTVAVGDELGSNGVTTMTPPTLLLLLIMMMMLLLVKWLMTGGPPAGRELAPTESTTVVVLKSISLAVVVVVTVIKLTAELTVVTGVHVAGTDVTEADRVTILLVDRVVGDSSQVWLGVGLDTLGLYVVMWTTLVKVVVVVDVVKSFWLKETIWGASIFRPNTPAPPHNPSSLSPAAMPKQTAATVAATICLNDMLVGLAVS